jgi:hypothetical protein
MSVPCEIVACRYQKEWLCGAMDMQRSARRPVTGNDLHRQLTRLEQSGSGYELHLFDQNGQTRLRINDLGSTRRRWLWDDFARV